MRRARNLRSRRQLSPNTQRDAIALLKKWVADAEESCRHDDLLMDTQEWLEGVAQQTSVS